MTFTSEEIAELQALRRRMPLRNFENRTLEEWIIEMVGLAFDAMAEDEQVYDGEDE